MDLCPRQGLGHLVPLEQTLCVPYPSISAQYQPLPLWAWARGSQALAASSLVHRLLLGSPSPHSPSHP